MKQFRKKKILICSDTHGKTEFLEQVLKSDRFDALYFLGDGEGLEHSLAAFPGCPAEIVMVRGNNDHLCNLPENAVIELGLHRLFLTHGNRYHLYMGYRLMEYAVREKNCDYCFFGHLHRPVYFEEEGITYLNPGSISEPRQTPHEPSCVVLSSDENGNFEFVLMNARDLSTVRLELCQ